MYSTKALVLIAALAGTSLSQKSDSPACSSAVSVFSGILTDAPATPTAILDFIASNTQIPVFTMGDAESHQSQLCAVAAALPSSLLPELQTLGSELMVFAHSHSSELVAYVTACVPDEDVARSTSYFDHVLTATNICAEMSTPTPGGASNGTYPTPTLTATSDISSSTVLIPTAAAARPTGALLRAAAAGGVVGAAAML